jgi:ATP-grasp domain, R2K clade family 3
MDNINVLFRASLAEEDELEISSKYFTVFKNRTLVESNSLIIARYSALPFYSELEDDLKCINSRLINSYSQHSYVADLKNWYKDLSDITPKTYFNIGDVQGNGPFILKGCTNSRKNLWNTHMYAKDKISIKDVYCRLMDDMMISEQDIYIRDYIPLKNFGLGLNGLPISEEYRFFFLGKEPIIGGFYWQNHISDIDPSLINPDKVPMSLLKQIGNVVSKNINFFVADIARTESGDWILIELNDGQMSGLSCIDPNEFYKNLNIKIKNPDFTRV